MLTETGQIIFMFFGIWKMIDIIIWLANKSVDYVSEKENIKRSGK